jgi:hypothetical protein
MQERHGHLPGYTGYIPKHLSDDYAVQTQGPRPQIPNYQGFIKGIASENMFGETYGKITEASALGHYHKGRDLPPDQKFKSVTQKTYTPQLRVPVMPLKPKVYPPLPRDPIQDVPETTLNRFYGVRDKRNPAEVEAATTAFYEHPDVDLDAQPPQQELKEAYTSFWGQGQEQADIALSKKVEISYDEARKLASSSLS